MESLEWWHWILAGLGLIMAELVLISFVVFWFGLGAVIVGLLLWLIPGLNFAAQMLLWSITSCAMVVLWFRLFKPHLHKSRVGMSDDATLIGEVGLMLHDVGQFQRGEVRFQKPMIGSERWGCIADEAIAAGGRVRVVSVEGTLVKVKKI